MKRFAVVLAAIGILAGAALATPITYTETGQVSGTLGVTTLTNVTFTFVFNGDTANIDASLSPFVDNIPISNSITIGASSGSFTSPVEVAVNMTPGIVGFINPTLSGGITIQSPGAVGYNLATPITLSNSSAFAGGPSFGTSLGALTITGAQNVTFTAAVPEPASITFIGAGLLGLVGFRSRRKRTY